MRKVTDQELAYERLGDCFETALSEYDTHRRIEVLISDFLSDEMVSGKEALDAGCGLGYFSEALVARGAKVTACDIGPELVAKTRRRAGCDGQVVDVLRLVE